MFLIDEGNFVPDDYATNVVLPMYMPEGVALIWMSSPLRKPCIMNWLTTVKNNKTGKLLFKTILLAEVCPDCKKNSATPEFCEHMISNRSDLKTHERIEHIMQAYPPKHVETRDQEILGITKRVSRIIPEESINSLMQRRVTIQSPIPIVGIGIDPGGGGASHTGITVFAKYPIGAKYDMTVVSFAFLITCPMDRAS